MLAGLMLGCFGNDRTVSNGKSDALLTWSGAAEEPAGKLAWCLTPVKDPEGGPFLYKVRFRPTVRLDAEAQVIKSLTELLWVDVEAKQNGRGSLSAKAPGKVATSHCVAALKKMKVSTLIDFVVPITNLVLHAPSKEVRSTLWDDFVVEAVQSDLTLAHLFVWALTAVQSNPLAESGPRKDAEKKLSFVSGTLAGKVHLANIQGTIKAANEAAKHGRAIPQVPRRSTDNVTPLVDLLQRLHRIGQRIVEVQDRALRLQTLRDLIEKDVNPKMQDKTAVPVTMLAPGALNPPPGDGETAVLLRLTITEARVLSSKARAPYLVCLEVESEQCCAEAALDVEGPASRIWSMLTCKRRSRSSALEMLRTAGNRKQVAWHPSVCSRGTPTPDGAAQNFTKPRGCFKDETWDEVVKRVRRTSEFGSRPGWGLLPLIVKSNADDLRQEELAYRLLKWFQRVFRRHKLQLQLQPFFIVATTWDGGALEVVSNAISLSELKKSYEGEWKSLRAYFEKAFPVAENKAHGASKGDGPVSLNTAIMNFIWSMAAYSIVCYVLAIRDRHNGNIMIDDEGHIIHVDFGFMLCGAPGGKAVQHMGGFEHSRGFKLTHELMEVLGPQDGMAFKVFRTALVEGMLAVRQHAEELIALLQLNMLGSENVSMNCFCHPRGYHEAVLEDLCERLGLPGGREGTVQNDEEFKTSVNRMIDESVDHWRSRVYDTWQFHMNGVQ